MNRLIECPDCHSAVSIEAESCPKCGSPIKKYMLQQNQIQKNKKNMNILSIIGGVLLLLAGIGAFSSSIISALMIIIGAILVFSFVKDKLAVKFSAVPRVVWNLLAGFLVVFGLFNVSSSEQNKRQKYLAEHPEVAQQEAKAQQEKAKAEEAEKAAKERERNTDKATLMTLCQINLQPNLKNPKSLDTDFSNSSLVNTKDGFELNMFYYATNSFGGEIRDSVLCKFDSSGNLVSIEKK